MKKLILYIPLALFALTLSSCCIFNCGSKGNYTEQEITKYRDEVRTVDPGPKGGVAYQVTEQVAYTETERVKVKCGSCLSYYCPKPDCCGIVSQEVLTRRTTQGASGEPHIGLIPTMKVLAE